MNYAVKNIYGKTNGKTVTVSVPGSKSITARAMLIAAICEGSSTLYGAQFSDDCETFLNCLSQLGIEYVREGTTLKIQGSGGKPPKKKAGLYVGSAGTAARFLPAFLAFCDGEYSLTCSKQMENRPIASLINSLKSVGAQFTFPEKENSYPFIIRGTQNANTDIEVDIGESSQFLSALLISAVCAKKPINIKVNGTHGRDYIDMTLNTMWSFGVNVEETEAGFTVEGAYSPKRYHIEPDVSAACYFYAMNKILGTDIQVNGIMPHSMQGDIKFINLLKNFDGGKVDMSSFSDQALTLAAIAPYFKNPTEIIGIAHIRKQECDRIRAIVENLTAMGVKCEERADGVKIYPSAPKPAHINTFGDHRVAMSFALTGLRADGIIIDNAEVCSKTFKDYFEVLGSVTEKLTV
ncbi:MAG: 3-phosphoshikimate 1-carboxyvinyltransferase [Clostridia bacterium]|nr:3-phosphoshikimate 1-carboxyvinyltransferase [Clostridia bacterium]